MSGVTKVVIVAVLVVMVGLVLAIKQGQVAPSLTAQMQPTDSKLPKLVDLGAGKCIPCKAMKPILDDLRTNYADYFQVVFIDVWEDTDKAKEYGIQTIPTQIFYDADGKELFRHEGFYGKEEILAKWKEFGIDTGPGVK